MIHMRTMDTRTMTNKATFLVESKQVRYRCSCGTVGSEWYTEDESGSGWDHARKAWLTHATYADDRGTDVRRG